MSKMTTEQFLSHLGIEVGKPFMVKDIECVIGYFDDRLVVYLKIIDEEQNFRELNWLLDKEITPLPKYTLTEEDKKLVSCMLYGTIRRNGACKSWRDDSGNIIATFYETVLNGLPDKVEVSLDELRKCL